MARPQSTLKIAQRYISGSCVQTCEITRYYGDGSFGAMPSRLEIVHISPTDKGTRHFSLKTEEIPPEPAVNLKAISTKDRRAIFVDGSYVEYVGSDEGWRKLLAQGE